MADIALGFQIWNYNGELNASDFVCIEPSSNWNNCTIQNDSAQDLIIRTTLDSAKTERTIPAGEGLQIAAVPFADGGPRFRPGRPAFYAKVGAGDGTGVWCVWA